MTPSSDIAVTPAAGQTFVYDLDGNITDDGRWVYTWDEENRLIAMETAAPAYTYGGVTRIKLTFAYDYLHRRVQKQTFAWAGSAWATLPTSDRRFTYDGWNVIMEDEWVTAKTRTYAWGLDIQGSLQGAAGVGGLVAVHDKIENPSGKLLLPGYDANGNVAVMVNGTNGDLEAAYEYGPFGESLRQEGPSAKVNPFRFSTKYTDDETGLNYYGRRYYDSRNGRFVGRDPIEEAGGINLYAFVANNTVNTWDLLGMYFDAEYSNGVINVTIPIVFWGDPGAEAVERFLEVARSKMGHISNTNGPDIVITYTVLSEQPEDDVSYNSVYLSPSSVGGVTSHTGNKRGNQTASVAIGGGSSNYDNVVRHEIGHLLGADDHYSVKVIHPNGEEETMPAHEFKDGTAARVVQIIPDDGWGGTMYGGDVNADFDDRTVQEIVKEIYTSKPDLEKAVMDDASNRILPVPEANTREFDRALMFRMHQLITGLKIAATAWKGGMDGAFVDPASENPFIGDQMEIKEDEMK